MRRMIAAQSYRLIHEKGFWGGLAVTILYALAVLAFSAYAMINNGRSIALDQLYFYGYGLDSFIPVAGLVLAAVISFFVGTEYSSQTLRNALIIGRTRTEIYQSDRRFDLSRCLCPDRCSRGLAGLRRVSSERCADRAGNLDRCARAGCLLRAVQCRWSAL